MHLLIRVVVMILLATTGSACQGEGPVSPALDTESFTLRQVDRRHLPAVLWREGGVTLEILEERLRFAPDGRVVRERRFRLTGEDGKLSEEASSLQAEYRISGGRIEIGRFEPCPPNALCIANDVGVVTRDGMTLRSRLYAGDGALPVLVYRRD